MDISIWLIVGFIIGIGVILFFYFKTPKTKMENCQKDDLVNWFKNENNLNLLKENNNYLAVVLNSSHELAKNLNQNELILAIFDEEKNDIVKSEIFECENISNEVIDMFSGKDMIVLK